MSATAASFFVFPNREADPVKMREIPSIILYPFLVLGCRTNRKSPIVHLPHFNHAVRNIQFVVAILLFADEAESSFGDIFAARDLYDTVVSKDPHPQLE